MRARARARITTRGVMDYTRSSFLRPRMKLSSARFETQPSLPPPPVYFFLSLFSPAPRGDAEELNRVRGIMRAALSNMAEDSLQRNRRRRNGIDPGGQVGGLDWTSKQPRINNSGTL